MDLSFNRLSDWSHVMCLGRLPKLEALFLGSNNLPDIPSAWVDQFAIPPEAEPHKLDSQIPLFRSLTTLYVDRNAIMSLASVHHLSIFPRLQALRINNQEGNTPEPAWMGMKSKAPLIIRSLALALLPAISRLNGSDITALERSDAEKGFLKWSSQLSISCPDRSPDVTATWWHRRNQSLFGFYVEKHGEPPKPSATDHERLRNKMVTISLRTELPHLPAPITEPVSLPLTTTVEALKMHIGKEHGGSGSLELYGLVGGSDSGSKSGASLEKMEDDTATLEYYGVADGDSVIARATF